jgi:hypothetical protein
MDILESNERKGRSRLAAVGLVGAGLLAGGTVATLGVASASGSVSSSPTATTNTNTNPGAGSQHRFGMGPMGGRAVGRGAGRGIHGSETVQTGSKTYAIINNQEGTITANDGTTIKVTSLDGFVATYSFDSKSRIGKNGAKATIVDLKVGDTVEVRALAQTSGNAIVARVRDGKPQFGGPEGGPGPIPSVPPSSGA